MHFASPASPIDFERIPIQILKVGGLGTHNCLGLAKAKGATFFLASTSEVYGDPQVHPQPETYWGNVNPIGPRGVYDEAKRFAEAMTMAYHRHHGLDVRIVRIFNTYGARMRADDGRAVSNFLVQALRGEPITVYGDGSQTRSFCYVDDEVRGFLALLDGEHHRAGQHRQPGEFTIRQLAELAIEVTGSSSDDHLRAAAGRRPDPAPARPHAGPRAARVGSRGSAARRSGAHRRVLPLGAGRVLVVTSARMTTTTTTVTQPACRARSCPWRPTPGDVVRAGHVLVLIESMKMHHDVVGRRRRAVAELLVRASGTAVMPGDPLVRLDPVDDDEAGEAVARRRRPPSTPRWAPSAPTWPSRSSATPSASTTPARTPSPGAASAGRRTARENVADLVDDGSFVEYGPLVIAAQRRRRELADLIANTPADGLVGGIGTVNGELFGPERARCIAMSYDYTVLAGTQGLQNHRKKDRLFELAETLRLPIVFFAEGGGGRPGDTDGTGPSGLDCLAFLYLRRAVRARAPRRRSTPATASPATPPSSAVATSSSPPRTPTSAWAARR